MPRGGLFGPGLLQNRGRGGSLSRALDVIALGHRGAMSEVIPGLCVEAPTDPLQSREGGSALRVRHPAAVVHLWRFGVMDHAAAGAGEGDVPVAEV